jgi:hypothetical protein
MGLLDSLPCSVVLHGISNAVVRFRFPVSLIWGCLGLPLGFLLSFPFGLVLHTHMVS